MSKDEMLRPHQVARRLGVGPQQVRKLLRQGKLEGEKISERQWQVPARALEAFRNRLNDD